MLLSIDRRLLSPLLLLFLMGWASPAFALSFNGYWDYRQSGGEGVKTRTEFQQRYNLGIGVGPGVTYRPTPAITATGVVGYSRNYHGTGNGLTPTEELTPSAQVSLFNDIFLAQVSGNTSTITTGSGAKRTTDSWGTTLASRWDMPLWPQLRLNYGERTETRGSATLDEPGTQDKYTGLALDWDLLLAQLSYQYNKSEIEDLATGTLTERQSQFARLETSGIFWNRRLNFTLAQQVRYATQDFTFGAAAREDGFFELPLAGAQAQAQLTDPVTGPDPEDVAPSSPFGDGTTLSVPAGQRLNLSVSFASQQQIDILRLSLDPLTSQESELAGLQWDLYIPNPNYDPSDPLNEPWKLAASGIPTTYDSSRKSFELAIYRRIAKFMVVATLPADLALTFTQVQPLSLLGNEFSGGTTNIDYLTNFSTAIRLTRTLTAYSSLAMENVKNSVGDNSFENGIRTVSGGLHWTPVPYITDSINLSENRQTQTGEPDQINRSYSVTMATIPLPTMNLVFGVTRTEQYSGEQNTLSGIRYNMTSKAQIYPDLDAALYLSQNYFKIWDPEGFFIDGSSFSSRLDLHAQLLRSLTGEIITNYYQRQSESGSSQTTSRQDIDSTLNMIYRPSDLLLLSGAYTRFFNSEASDRLRLTLGLQLINTPKTRLTFNLNHTQAE
ncbi:MAG: hypothetical protein P8Y63_10225, partial [Deltaproteobacteria bacterium]